MIKTTTPPVQQRECICNDYDGKGKSTCGFDCPIHSVKQTQGWERKLHSILNEIAEEVWYQDRGCEERLVESLNIAEKKLKSLFTSQKQEMIEWLNKVHKREVNFGEFDTPATMGIQYAEINGYNKALSDVRDFILSALEKEGG